MDTHALLAAALLLSSTPCLAANEEGDHLARISLEYARCLDSALGNFSSDEETQAAGAVFYKAILTNVKEMIEIDQKDHTSKVHYFIKVLGKDIATGLVLGALSKPDDRYEEEKKKLKEKMDHDWRRVNQELWQKYSCNAIYASLTRPQ